MQLPERLSPQSILLVNQAAVKLCANDILGAKDTLDELMALLDVKLVTTVSSSDSMLPQYLIHTLVYFFLKTSKLCPQSLTCFRLENFKMARQLTKHRRFVQEPASTDPQTA